MTGSTNDFELDSISGALRTRRSLDRETVAQYVLTVQAVDGEGNTGRTGYAQVSVQDALRTISPVYIHLMPSGDYHCDRCQ